VPSSAATLERLSTFRILLSGRELPAANIFYAGVAPGFPGLYQINMRMPEDVDRDLEIRIGFGDLLSPAGVRLHTFSGNP
jgi:uncharacterized protein (TIGR03437 family)